METGDFFRKPWGSTDCDPIMGRGGRFESALRDSPRKFNVELLQFKTIRGGDPSR